MKSIIKLTSLILNLYAAMIREIYSTVQVALQFGASAGINVGAYVSTLGLDLNLFTGLSIDLGSILNLNLGVGIHIG